MPFYYFIDEKNERIKRRSCFVGGCTERERGGGCYKFSVIVTLGCARLSNFDRKIPIVKPYLASFISSIGINEYKVGINFPVSDRKIKKKRKWWGETGRKILKSKQKCLYQQSGLVIFFFIANFLFKLFFGSRPKK